MSRYLTSLKRHLMNARGTRVDRKLVVIESDDWGSIRMPSREVFDKLQREGHRPEADPYLRCDALETNDDLERLFTELGSVKDGTGRTAVITANAVVANPDFEKIRMSGFEAYHYEPFYVTCSRYAHRDRVKELWIEGAGKAVFIPQFHGREHLHVRQWMRDLKDHDPLLRKAFDLGMISISSEPSRLRFGYMEGMDHFNEGDRLAKKEVLETGHALFMETMGYGSRSFIANCYIWDDTVEEVLRPLGIRVMQGIFNQLMPQGNGKHVPIRHYMGQVSSKGMKYSIRNVFFEPALEPGRDWEDEAMSRIRTAFLWRKPAIIGSHRLNYISSIDAGQGERNVKALGSLLRRVMRTWPDAAFVSSAELAGLL